MAKKPPSAKPLAVVPTSTQKALAQLAYTQKTARVQDALVNAFTGVGTERSKLSGAGYADDDLLLPAELEILFANNDLVYTIVTKIVEDALRAGFSVERKDNAEDDHALAEEVEDALRDLDMHEVLFRGGSMGRLFGGAGVILGVAGSGALSTPLDDAGGGGIVSLTEWDRQDLLPLAYYPTGAVETYTWTRPPAPGGKAWAPVVVHETRLVVFPGALTTTRRRNMNDTWDLSVLQRVYASLLSFDSMFASVDAMFSDASQAVFRIQGLIASLAEADGVAGTSDVATRLRMMDMLRSPTRAIVLDAGNESGAAAESFEVIDRASLGTLDGVMGQYYIRLAAAARYPLTVLLGMSPAGMNATGDSDLLLYFNSVDVFRNRVLTPILLRFVQIVARSLGDESPEEWVVKWPELQRPKPLDVATAEKMRIDSAVALITAQAVLPEEVALSLKRIAPSLGLTIDAEARRTALTEALKELSARELTTPAPLPEVEPKGVAPAAKATARKTPAKAKGRQTS